MRVKENELSGEQFERVLQVLKEQGKQYEVAEKLGVSASHVSRVLKGRHPGRMLLEKMVEVFKINKVWLYEGIGDQYITVTEETREFIDMMDTIKVKWPTLSLAKRYEIAGRIMGLLTE